MNQYLQLAFPYLRADQFRMPRRKKFSVSIPEFTSYRACNPFVAIYMLTSFWGDPPHFPSLLRVLVNFQPPFGSSLQSRSGFSGFFHLDTAPFKTTPTTTTKDTAYNQLAWLEIVSQFPKIKFYRAITRPRWLRSFVCPYLNQFYSLTKLRRIFSSITTKLESFPQLGKWTT